MATVSTKPSENTSHDRPVPSLDGPPGGAEAPRQPFAGSVVRARVRALVPALVLVGVVLAIASVNPRFLSARALSSAASDASPMLVLVLGSTPVILIGGIDLSVAALASLSSILAALWLPSLGSAGILAVIGAAAALGGLQGYVHAKAQIPSFVVTLGGLGIFSGLALYLSDATTQAVDGSYPLLDWLAGSTSGVPNSIITVVLVCTLLATVFRFTSLGRWIYATGAGEAAAALCGVRTDYVRVVVFALSGACAALAAMLLVAQTSYSAPTLADNLLLPTITGVVVGGTAISGGVGGLWSGLAGGLTVAAVRLGTVVLGFGPALQAILFGSGILVAVALTTDRRKIGIIK